MVFLLPESVQPKPLLVSPPRCLSGETMMTDLPIFLACTPAVTAAEVPP